MRNDKSMIDVAYDVLEKDGNDLSFTEIMNRVAADLEMSEEEKTARLGTLYTDLTLDGRFVAMKDTKWGLRKNHTYDKVHISTAELYSADEEGEDAKEEGEDAEGGSGEDADNDQSMDAGYNDDVAEDRKEAEYGTDGDIAHLVGQDN